MYSTRDIVLLVRRPLIDLGFLPLGSGSTVEFATAVAEQTLIHEEQNDAARIRVYFPGFKFTSNLEAAQSCSLEFRRNHNRSYCGCLLI